MAVFVNTVTPQLRIYIPATGDYVQFSGGRLEIDEGEPGYEEAMANALVNPSTSIIVNSTTCQYCGEVFNGKAAAAQLGKHKKDAHFNLWQAEKEIEHATVIQKEVKARAGYACDVCQPTQTFGTADDLAEHAKLLHTAPPELDAEGNERDGERGRRPGEVGGIPAATPK
jgi:hypothetical protein